MRLFWIALTVLASVGFFNPYGVLSDQAQKLVFYVCVLIGIGMAFKRTAKDYPLPCRGAYVGLLISIIFSAIMASAFHAQSLLISLMAILPYLCGYALFFVLWRFQVDADKIMYCYLGLCACSIIVYFANLATFPNNIFGASILGEDITRGILRVPVVFIEFFPVVLFYCINRFLIDKKKRWILIAMVAMLMIILSVIRQVIALSIVFALWFWFRNVNWKAKLALCVGVLAMVAFVLPEIPLYNTMLELSERQKDENEEEENIRITAWRYYTYENQDNFMTAIFGHGIPSMGNSPWGNQFDADTQATDCLPVDVGWAGFYWYFGVVAVGCLMFMMGKGIFKPKPFERQYAAYGLAFLFLTSFASGPPVMYWQIVDIAMCLYMANSCVSCAPVSSDAVPAPSVYAFRYPQLISMKGGNRW